MLRSCSFLAHRSKPRSVVSMRTFSSTPARGSAPPTPPTPPTPGTPAGSPPTTRANPTIPTQQQQQLRRSDYHRQRSQHNLRFPNTLPRQKGNNVDGILYTASVLMGFLGLTYAAVPLYRMFCQATGYGGTVRTDSSYFHREKMTAQRDAKKIRISFNADTAKSLPWQFRPQQSQVQVHPGETSLIFYEALNRSEKDIVGISTYNVVPMKAGAYFNKIQVSIRRVGVGFWVS